MNIITPLYRPYNNTNIFASQAKFVNDAKYCHFLQYRVFHFVDYVYNNTHAHVAFRPEGAVFAAASHKEKET